MNFPFQVYLGLTSLLKYFFVENPWAFCFSRQFVDNDKRFSFPEHLDAFQFQICDLCLLFEAEVSLAEDSNTITILYFMICCVAIKVLT